MKRPARPCLPLFLGRLLVLLLFLCFSFSLLSQLGLFLLFPFAFIFLSLVAHVRFSLPKPIFPMWRLPSNVTEPTWRYRIPASLAFPLGPLSRPGRKQLAQLSRIELAEGSHPHSSSCLLRHEYAILPGIVVATRRYQNIRIGSSGTCVIIPA